MRRDLACVTLLMRSCMWTGKRIRLPLFASRALNGLPDPPGRIGGEFIPKGGIEFLDGPAETKESMLNDVIALHSLGGKLLDE